MKYKHVFFLWIWANLILALGALLTVFVVSLPFGSRNNDWGMFLLVFAYGFFISLPSLVTMLCFHYFYSQKSILKKDYFKVYSLVILVVNVLYLLCSYFIFKMGGEFSLLYLFTTLAGFISLYLVHLKIKKEERKEMIA
ncbi:MAG: hypothetical protein KA319_09670 [Ferruginibacter sp.]|nr:hypothetical protein [Ferruginibacter sp.]